MQIQKELDIIQAEKSKISEEKDHLQDEAISTKASLQQKDMHIEELQKEVMYIQGYMTIKTAIFSMNHHIFV